MKHESSGYSPFELMLGRKPGLTVDNIFQLDNTSFISTDYVQELQHRMKTAQHIVKRILEQASLKQKSGYDRKASAAILEPGDKVLVKILAFSGPHKLSDKHKPSV